jgi:hypothetical protein
MEPIVETLNYDFKNLGFDNFHMMEKHKLQMGQFLYLSTKEILDKGQGNGRDTVAFSFAVSVFENQPATIEYIHATLWRFRDDGEATRLTERNYWKAEGLMPKDLIISDVIRGERQTLVDSVRLYELMTSGALKQNQVNFKPR